MSIEDKKDLILELWARGISSGEISRQLGVTRNSVMGFVHRMKKKGILGDERQGKKNKTVTLKKAEAPKLIVTPPAEIRQEIVPVAYTKQRFKSIEPDTGLHAYFQPPKKGVSMMDLGLRSCRFIISKEDAPAPIYCGDEIQRGSYCKEHANFCYYSAQTGVGGKSSSQNTKAA